MSRALQSQGFRLVDVIKGRELWEPGRARVRVVWLEKWGQIVQVPESF